jgi:hypothetical protein
MREICMSGLTSGVWRRSQGRTSEAPPNERGGNRYVRPTATAPHLDSTELQASVIKEQDQPAPVVQRVADRLGQRGTTGDAAERVRQPCLHRLDEWTTALLADPSAFVGGLATDLVSIS